jgi:hypothetical protein
MKSAFKTNGLLTAWLGPTAAIALGCGGAMESESPTTGGAPSTSTMTCVPGTEYCHCYGNGTCNAGFACVANYCRLPTSIAVGGATSTTVNQGGVLGSGGTQTTTTATTCAANTNLIAEALGSTSSNWIGGDPASATDNPCGVQGAVYAISDAGLDSIPGGSDATIRCRWSEATW